MIWGAIRVAQWVKHMLLSWKMSSIPGTHLVERGI